MCQCERGVLQIVHRVRQRCKTGQRPLRSCSPTGRSTVNWNTVSSPESREDRQQTERGRQRWRDVSEEWGGGGRHETGGDTVLFGFSSQQQTEWGSRGETRADRDASIVLSFSNWFICDSCGAGRALIKMCFSFFSGLFWAARVNGSSQTLSAFGLLTCPLRLKRSCLLFWIIHEPFIKYSRVKSRRHQLPTILSCGWDAGRKQGGLDGS